MKALRMEGVGNVLLLGAHSDDIEIGCGGTILKMLRDFPGLSVTWVVFSADGVRGDEARVAATSFLKGAKEPTVELHRFRDGFFPHDGSRIKSYFEELKGRVSPDVVFTHYRNDLHQDHRMICELTWNTFRNHLILEYEVPKWDGDLGSPNAFVHLDLALYTRKVDILLESFPSQTGKHWFSRELFLGLMRIRGMESNAPAHHAEAFYARKVVL